METSVTSEQRKRASEKLSRWVELEQRIVTYREIAREVAVDINSAKNLLAAHFEANPALFPTYLLSGTYLPEDSGSSINQNGKRDTSTSSQEEATQMEVDDEDLAKTDNEAKPRVIGLKEEDACPLKNQTILRRAMLLVGGKNMLEEKSQLLIPNTVSIQLYSLSSSSISDPAQYLPPTLRLRQRDDYRDASLYGSLSGNFALNNTNKPGESSKSAAAKAIVTKSKQPTAPATAKSVTKASAENKPTRNTEITKDTKGIRKKKVTSESPSDTETESELVKGKGKKVSIPGNKFTRPLAKLNSADAEKLIIESFWDDEAAGVPSSDAMVAEEDMLEGEDTSARVSGKGIVGSRPGAIQKRGTTSSADDAGSSLATKEDGAVRVRKRRRVVRSETKMNSKGYIVTEDVSGEESYSSDEGVPRAPKKPKKIASTVSAQPIEEEIAKASKPKTVTTKGTVAGASKTKKKGQQSLTSFFKKS